MEPVTHLLTGAVLARAGFNRRAAYATAAMVLAAEFPDLDSLWDFAGPVTMLEHHRGITHTFLAVPFEAALVTAVFYAYHRFRKQRASTKPKAPANWPWLFLGTLVALLSHLLLDWTNNYGLRPFFPFDPRWYAGSFVFIAEPVLYLLLAGALILPALFALINSEVGTRKQTFRGRPSAIAALILIAVFYVFRFNQHAAALTLAVANTPQSTRVFASPHPLDPFLWHTIADTPDAYQLATINTRTGIVAPPTPSDTLFNPPTTLALLAAKRTYLGRIYLDWSPYPVLTETPDLTDPNHPLTLITFTDARFLYNVSLLHGRTAPPLTGTVLLDMAAPAPQRLIETRMDNRPQH